MFLKISVILSPDVEHQEYIRRWITTHQNGDGTFFLCRWTSQHKMFFMTDDITSYQSSAASRAKALSPFFRMLWTMNVEVECEVEGKRVVVPPSAVMFITPGALLGFSKETGHDCLLVEFSWQYLQGNSSQVNDVLELLFYRVTDFFHIHMLDSEERSSVMVLLNQLKDTADSSIDTQELLTRRGYVSLILISVVRAEQKKLQLTTGENSSYNSLVSQESMFLRLLEKHFHHEHQSSFYCSELGCERSELDNVLATKLGLTVQQIIDRRIITEACRLLRHSPLPTSLIASGLGFENKESFNAFFLKNKGISALEYRDEG